MKLNHVLVVLAGLALCGCASAQPGRGEKNERNDRAQVQRDPDRPREVRARRDQNPPPPEGRRGPDRAFADGQGPGGGPRMIDRLPPGARERIVQRWRQLPPEARERFKDRFRERMHDPKFRENLRERFMDRRAQGPRGPQGHGPMADGRGFGKGPGGQMHRGPRGEFGERPGPGPERFQGRAHGPGFGRGGNTPGPGGPQGRGGPGRGPGGQFAPGGPGGGQGWGPGPDGPREPQGMGPGQRRGPGAMQGGPRPEGRAPGQGRGFQDRRAPAPPQAQPRRDRDRDRMNDDRDDDRPARPERPDRPDRDGPEMDN